MKLLGLIFAIVVFISGNLPLPVYSQALTVNNPSVTKVSIHSSIVLKGLSLYPNQPLNFDFIVEPRQNSFPHEGRASEESIKQEALALAKYFLACLTIPEDDLWVNLSPYEKNRIVPESLSQTLLGHDMLSQDLFLKTMTANLMNPDSSSGKEFWQKIYQQVQEKYGNTQVPVNTFNKVWIVPDKAAVYEKGKSVFIVQRHLKVMLEEDYLAQHKNQRQSSGIDKVEESGTVPVVIKEFIIPALEKEVNEGDGFAPLRQIYDAMILSAWYKQKVKETIIAKQYVNQSKVSSLNQEQLKTVEVIYQQYLKTVKQGVFNMIKEEADPQTGELIPRKYFAGGLTAVDPKNVEVIRGGLRFDQQKQLPTDRAMVVSIKMHHDQGMTVKQLTIEDSEWHDPVKVVFKLIPGKRMQYGADIFYGDQQIKPIKVKGLGLIARVGNKILRLEQHNEIQFQNIRKMFDRLNKQGKAPRLLSSGQLEENLYYYIVERINGRSLDKLEKVTEEIIGRLIDLIDYLVRERLDIDFSDSNVMINQEGRLLLHDLELVRDFDDNKLQYLSMLRGDDFDFDSKKMLPQGLSHWQDYIIDIKVGFINSPLKEAVLKALKTRRPADMQYLAKVFEHIDQMNAADEAMTTQPLTFAQLERKYLFKHFSTTDDLVAFFRGLLMTKHDQGGYQIGLIQRLSTGGWLVKFADFSSTREIHNDLINDTPFIGTDFYRIALEYNEHGSISGVMFLPPDMKDGLRFSPQMQQLLGITRAEYQSRIPQDMMELLVKIIKGIDVQQQANLDLSLTRRVFPELSRDLTSVGEFKAIYADKFNYSKEDNKISMVEMEFQGGVVSRIVTEDNQVLFERQDKRLVISADIPVGVDGISVWPRHRGGWVAISRDFDAPVTIFEALANGNMTIWRFNKQGQLINQDVWYWWEKNSSQKFMSYEIIPYLARIWPQATEEEHDKWRFILDRINNQYMAEKSTITFRNRLRTIDARIKSLIAQVKGRVRIHDVASSSGLTSVEMLDYLSDSDVEVISSDKYLQFYLVRDQDGNSGIFDEDGYLYDLKHSSLEKRDKVQVSLSLREMWESSRGIAFSRDDPQVLRVQREANHRFKRRQLDILRAKDHEQYHLVRCFNLIQHLSERQVQDLLQYLGITVKDGGYLILGVAESSGYAYRVWQMDRVNKKLVYVGTEIENYIANILGDLPQGDIVLPHWIKPFDSQAMVSDNQEIRTQEQFDQDLSFDPKGNLLAWPRNMSDGLANGRVYKLKDNSVVGVVQGFDAPRSIIKITNSRITIMRFNDQGKLLFNESMGLERSLAIGAELHGLVLNLIPYLSIQQRFLVQRTLRRMAEDNYQVKDGIYSHKTLTNRMEILDNYLRRVINDPLNVLDTSSSTGVTSVELLDKLPIGSTVISTDLSPEFFIVRAGIYFSVFDKSGQVISTNLNQIEEKKDLERLKNEHLERFRRGQFESFDRSDLIVTQRAMRDPSHFKRISLDVFDVSGIQRQQNEYDIVRSMNFIQHIPKHKRIELLENLGKMTKEGGMVIIGGGGYEALYWIIYRKRLNRLVLEMRYDGIGNMKIVYLEDLPEVINLDEPMTSPGGIDLDSRKLDLEIQPDVVSPWEVPNAATGDKINALIPVIIGIAPFNPQEAGALSP